MLYKIAMLAATSIAAAVSLGGTASAAPPVAGFVGSAPSSVAGCPYIEWRLARHTNGSVTGLAYYSDLSGTSQVTGDINSAGVFQLQLASVMGQGPTGTVTGKRLGNGEGDATLKGPGCANMHVVMKAVSNMAEYHTSNG